MFRTALVTTLISATLWTPVGHAQIATIPVASNLSFPLSAAAPAGDATRLFIVGRLGTIVILEDGMVGTTPFLDIQSKVLSANAEQGLLGLAFHPDYATNGQFFVSYTGGTGNGMTVIERYEVSVDPNVADPASAHSVFEWPQTAPGHNGGHIVFGPDGYLYLGLGDSTWGAFAQDPLELLGKFIRIDVDGDDFPGDAIQNYAIPPDNPWVGVPGVRDEIWSFGVRNPNRFSFDAVGGALYIGDVGRDSVEEIDVAPGGGGGLNFGWPIMEGSICTDSTTTCNAGGEYTLPAYEWPHTGACHAATGGTVYRGAVLPASIQGHYFFTDFCDLPTKIWSFTYVGGVVTNFTDWTSRLNPNGDVAFVSAIVPDGVGELYLVEYRATGGQVHKIVPNPTSAIPSVGDGSRRTIVAIPNPFRTATRIEWVRPETPVTTSVGVYSASGRLVRTLTGAVTNDREANVVWDGRDGRGDLVSAGVYFVRAETPDGPQMGRLVRLR